MGFSRQFVNMTERFVKFCVSGVAATGAHFLLLYLVVEYFEIHPVVATVIAFLGAFHVSLFFSWFWIFHKIKRNFSVWMRHMIVAIVGLCVNSAVMYVVVELIGLGYEIGFLVGILISPIVTFAMLSRLVYS